MNWMTYCQTQNGVAISFGLTTIAQIVNELRKLIPNEDWIDCLFVSKSCFLENGQLDEKEFLKSMGLIEFDESNLVFHFEHN
ncbi:hypothetical protein [Moraxella catarrhalis]|uniref:hypothetical protein n=1 Tax=Moraxella catarrhalis TaxID=480 RepID=UPI001D0D9A63|nr:hypothetical protein [Moraxella catarrhalis]